MPRRDDDTRRTAERIAFAVWVPLFTLRGLTLFVLDLPAGFERLVEVLSWIATAALLFTAGYLRMASRSSDA